jgi:hypothetical protein
MTAQASESLTYNGEEFAMCTEPLSAFFSAGGKDPGFVSMDTACWRGYVGEWEVLEDRLYMVGLEGMLEGGTEATLETVFPGFPDRVFAHWYSGTIRIPQGKLLDYVHMGYASVYERDLILTLENGVLKSSEVRENGESESDTAPEGYGIGAMTVFPRNVEPDDSE